MSDKIGYKPGDLVRVTVTPSIPVFTIGNRARLVEVGCDGVWRANFKNCGNEEGTFNANGDGVWFIGHESCFEPSNEVVVGHNHFHLDKAHGVQALGDAIIITPINRRMEVWATVYNASYKKLPDLTQAAADADAAIAMFDTRFPA